MGNTRDLFKKIRDTKGTFHAKMDTIKDRNGMDLTEAEDIKKRWRDYTDDLLDHQKSQRVPEKHLLQCQRMLKLLHNCTHLTR